MVYLVRKRRLAPERHHHVAGLLLVAMLAEVGSFLHEPAALIEDVTALPSARAEPAHRLRVRQPLGVDSVCGRRQLLTHAQLGGCKGDMKELRD